MLLSVKEVTVPPLFARFMVTFILVMLVVGGLALAENGGFSGNVGLEIIFTSIPPFFYEIESGLSLSVSVPWLTFEADLGLDLSGFQSQGFAIAIDLDAVQIAEEIRFDPHFSWQRLSVGTQVVGMGIGADLIVSNIGSVQTPNFSVGAVLDLSGEVSGGFSCITLTGFGAVGLVNLLGGVEAPFSYELLHLFSHLSDLSLRGAPDPRVTIVPGFYFEEELVRLTVDHEGFLASSTTWLSPSGFVKEIAEFGYRFEEPSLAFLTAVTLESDFFISAFDFMLDIDFDFFQLNSKTMFAVPVPPSPPVEFLGQGFVGSFEVFDVLVTGEADFDASFLFDQGLLAIEAKPEPVTLTSLTRFGLGGFAGEWITVGVGFNGGYLYTTTAFDSSGITEFSFGFELEFQEQNSE